MEMILKCVQWKLKLVSSLSAEELAEAIKQGKEIELTSYDVSNPGPDGRRGFYSAANGKYGQPLLTAEPDRALELPKNLVYVNSRGEEQVPTEKLCGFIINADDGSVAYRYSLTNAENKKISYGFQADGSFLVDGNVYWLHTLFSKDKNRMFNPDGYFGPVKTTRVAVLELADLRFSPKAPQG